VTVTGRPPKLRLTAEARRARRWSILLGLASSLAIVAVSLLALLIGTVLALGRGPLPVTVPDVQGRTLEEAKRVLESAGLQTMVVAEVFDEKATPGSVVRQRPYAGKYVKQGRMVELVLSKGPKSVKVPALVGKTLEEAQTLLSQAYLQVGNIRREPSAKPADTVLEQRPAAQQIVDRGTAVDLRVSGGESYGSWKAPSGEEWVFQRLDLIVPAGPSLQRVRVVLEQDGEDEVIYDEMRRPGEKVSLDIRGRRSAKVKVYLEENRVFTQRL